MLGKITTALNYASPLVETISVLSPPLVGGVGEGDKNLYTFFRR
jgi:hypothetical protein